MTYIYIVTPNGDEFPCKVGISENPDSRLAQLQCGSPNKLAVRETFWFETRAEALAMERLFHDSYVEWRMNGEWFGITFEQANYWLFENVVWVPENLGGGTPSPELAAQYEILSRPELRLV